MIPAIHDRRSIRKFQSTPIPKKDIEEILRSAIASPSSKNRQPWRFTVVQGDEKKAALDALSKGIRREESGEALLPESRQHLFSAKRTIEIMDEAPVIIFVENTLARPLRSALSTEDRVGEICNVQSIGAAIENMLLEATDKGLGSLWVCDIFFAYDEINKWLGAGGELVAALALGYPAQFPPARPRKAFDDVVVWRG